MGPETKTPEGWLATDRYKGVVIYDPDGWDRRNFAADWSRPVTEAEFRDRLTRWARACSANWDWLVQLPMEEVYEQSELPGGEDAAG